jgi:hypothetical protein
VLPNCAVRAIPRKLHAPVASGHIDTFYGKERSAWGFDSSTFPQTVLETCIVQRMIPKHCLPFFFLSPGGCTHADTRTLDMLCWCCDGRGTKVQLLGHLWGCNQLPLLLQRLGLFQTRHDQTKEVPQISGPPLDVLGPHRHVLRQATLSMGGFDSSTWTQTVLKTCNVQSMIPIPRGLPLPPRLQLLGFFQTRHDHTKEASASQVQMHVSVGQPTWSIGTPFDTKSADPLVGSPGVGDSSSP